MRTNAKPIFVVGAQRSGTTLLRLILNAHPEIAIPEEATFLMPLLTVRTVQRTFSEADRDSLVNYLRENDQLKLWGYDFEGLFSRWMFEDSITVKRVVEDLFSQYAKLEGKSCWGDKTPSFFRRIDVLNSLFPEAKFLHIVRDGRDVFDSWRKLNPARDKAAVMAADWKYKIRKIERSFRRIPTANRLTIRYEDLLEAPEKTVACICECIGMPYNSDMLSFHKTSRSYIGDHHSDLIFKPIQAENRGKWKKNLTHRERKHFMFMSGNILKKYDYEIETEPLRFSDLLALVGTTAVGIPQRIWEVFSVRRSYARALRSGKAVQSVAVGMRPRGLGDRVEDSSQGRDPDDRGIGSG